MLKKSINSVRTWSIAFACVAVLVSVSCSSDSSGPTAPSPAPAPAPAPAPTPAPTPVTANVGVQINPNPVPFSGAPITDAASCAGSANTWFYEQVFTETAGAAVLFTTRTDEFDGRITSANASTSITVPARGSFTLKSRWCSSSSVSHTAKSTFYGTDANGHEITVSGGTVQLRSR